MIKDRPCGACAALVPADTGCEHWKPQTRLTRQSRRAAAKSQPRKGKA